MNSARKMAAEAEMRSAESGPQPEESKRDKLLIGDSSQGTSNVKRLLVLGGSAFGLTLLFVWGIVATANASICASELADSDNARQLQKGILDRLASENAALTQRLGEETRANQLLRQQKKELESLVDLQRDEIARLRSQVALKDVELEHCRVQLKSQNSTIQELTHTIQVQAEEIKARTDEADEYYSDLRLSIGLLNQELNRNQAVQKELELYMQELAECNERQKQLLDKLDWLRRNFSELALAKQMLWLRYTTLQRLTKTELNMTKVFTGTKEHCDSDNFYVISSQAKPNLFVATEEDSGLRFGGVTVESWMTVEGGWKQDDLAFTFSLTNETACELQEPQHAINTNRTGDDFKFLLTFGSDLWIADQCLVQTHHIVSPNHVYKCPSIGRDYFYTVASKPRLSSFEFYRLDIIHRL